VTATFPSLEAPAAPRDAAVSGTGVTGALKIFVGTAAVGRVSVTANPLTVPASGGASTVAALVLDINGNPLVGSQVTFTSTAGTLSSNLTVTNGNGVAVNYTYNVQQRWRPRAGRLVNHDTSGIWRGTDNTDTPANPRLPAASSSTSPDLRS
jgi:hypothetical protein